MYRCFSFRRHIENRKRKRRVDIEHIYDSCAILKTSGVRIPLRFISPTPEGTEIIKVRQITSKCSQFTLIKLLVITRICQFFRLVNLFVSLFFGHLEFFLVLNCLGPAQRSERYATTETSVMLRSTNHSPIFALYYLKACLEGKYREDGYMSQSPRHLKAINSIGN